jgi:hypothetical protein
VLLKNSKQELHSRPVDVTATVLKVSNYSYAKSFIVNLIDYYSRGTTYR